MAEDSLSSWREQLQQSSFRGVEFYIDDHSVEFGRRVQLHDYPFKDDAYPEDLGGKDESYSFPAFVIGDDYMQQRDKLRDALKKKGSGILVHRYLGRLRVQIGSASMRETSAEGGIARFNINCYKAGTESKPTSTVDTQQKVAAAANTAQTVVSQTFQNNFTIAGFPGWVKEKAQTVLSDLESSFSGVGVIDNTISEYVSLPEAIAGKVIATMGTFSSMTKFRKLFNYGDSLVSVPTTTPSRIQEATNQQSIVNLVRQSSTIEAARLSSSLTYDSAQDAIAVRDELSGAIDEQMQTADDDTYLALQDVRVQMVKDMTLRAANLKQIRTFTPQETVSSLVLAHQLYQDASRAEDIITRNSIGHPGFIKGGQALEVLDA